VDSLLYKLFFYSPPRKDRGCSLTLLLSNWHEVNLRSG